MSEEPRYTFSGPWTDDEILRWRVQFGIQRILEQEEESVKNGERPRYGLERGEMVPPMAGELLRQMMNETPTGRDDVPTHRLGRFVDEYYVEDDEEAERLAVEEGLRSSRMLGTMLLLSFILIVLGVAAWTLWRATFGS